MLTGIDISHWQGNMKFSDYAIDFVIMKASEGNGYKDPMLDTHYNALHGSSDGKPELERLYGFYHYARPDLNNTAQEEAEWFLSLVGHHSGHAVFALDWEGQALSYSPDWALNWLEYVYEETGVRPLLYISASEENTGIYNKIRDANYGLWVAHYGVDSPRVKQWPFWAMWQKQGSPLDIDIFNGSVEAWRKYAGSIKKHDPPVSISAGDKVKILKRTDYNGHVNDSWVLNAIFDVISVDEDRVVVGRNGAVTGAWHMSNLRKV